MGHVETDRLLDPRYLNLEGGAAEVNPLPMASSSC